MIRWANLIGPETVAALNDRVVELARSLKVTRGRKLRIDATVVETDIHHPTDSRLLGDGVRVVSRLLRRAKTVLGEQVALGQQAFRTRTRSVRRLAQQLHRVARRTGEQAAEDLREAYAKLIAIARASRAQAARVRTALQAQGEARAAAGRALRPRAAAGRAGHRPGHAPRLTGRAGAQRGEAPQPLRAAHSGHPAAQARKPTEFGRKVLLREVEGGIISHFAVLDDVGLEHPHFVASLDAHRARFGHPPDLVAGDRGLYSPENEERARARGGKHIVLPKTGRLSRERRQHERQRWFRRGFRFRAGAEGRIHVLKRDYGLGCCRDHGQAGMGRWVGWGIVTHNLAQIARTQAARPGRPRRRVA
jgi:transposase, IS5 family